jgi:hypothetical protein
MRPSTHGPPAGPLVIALVVTVILAIGVWYLFLRGDGSASEFQQAYDKVTEATETAIASVGDVTRFKELEAFNAVIEEQMKVMRHQQQVFERIADDNGDDRAAIASEAADATGFIVAATFEYRTAIVQRKLTTASKELEEINQGKALLDDLRSKWKNLG